MLHRERLHQIAQDLVRTPSENMPPVGAETSCQEYVLAHFRRCGLQTEAYRPDEVEGIKDHRWYWPGRDYAGRYNVAGRRKGSGGGRSLILSGHIDTVPAGSQPWTRGPFSGEIDGNRLYGRGANDMKAGVAMNLFVAEELQRRGVVLQGDLLIETVVDEEFGGANGTLAGRVRGDVADGAIITEPSFLRVCPAQRGGRTAHITLRASGGVLTGGMFPSGVINALRFFLNEVDVFAAKRRAKVEVHPMYAACADPVPVSITKVTTGPWGFREPITIPEECRIEMYWQMMPGETQEEVEREFFAWLRSLAWKEPQLFPQEPAVELPIRWMPGSFTAAADPLVQAMCASASAVLGRAPEVAGIEGPCDLFLFHEFGMPALLWGPRGGNTHAADEYVELDTLDLAAEALLDMVCRWCGVAD
ncbi:MAG: M20/M25/M40 family metallo-hydrolase [Bryobacteraceae bacterium]